jgi:NADP-dependent 3-hydroxy acid dehydrogenase YdfG
MSGPSPSPSRALPGSGRTAVVTGASSGIGAATAERLAAEGYSVVLGARRRDRLTELAERIGGRALPLDVTDDASVAAFVAELDRVDVLVNNAGGAFDAAPVAQADVDAWQRAFDVNVLGTLRMTKALLPALLASGDGHVVTVTSLAATDTYDNGAGYCAAKHAQAVLHRTLRGELLGQPVRLTEVLPGLVETEFSVVRFGGDTERAANVYRGLTPLHPDDVADVIAFAATRPPHVNLDQIVVKARDQASVTRVHRRES